MATYMCAKHGEVPAMAKFGGGDKCAVCADVESAHVAAHDGFNAFGEMLKQAYLESQPRSKYHRIIKGVEVDIYDILVAWGVTCPARQHAIKKLLMAGERGAKGVVQDLDEAIQATERAKELVG